MPGNPWYVKDGSTVRIDEIIYEAKGSNSSGSYTIKADQVTDEATQYDARRTVQLFLGAIRSSFQTFEINNSVFNYDPANGLRKKCTLYYRMHPDRPLLCQTVYEHEFMNFGNHCIEIKYGGQVVNNSAVYQRFNRALRTALERDRGHIADAFRTDRYADDAVEVNNDNCGGDTDVGKTKTVRVIIRDALYPRQIVEAQEGEKWPGLTALRDALKKG